MRLRFLIRKGHDHAVQPPRERKSIGKTQAFDGHWDVEVSLNRSVPGFDDNVSIRIAEHCPAATKQICGDEIAIGITAAEARTMARRLLDVAAQDEAAAHEESDAAAEGAAAPARKPRRDSVCAPFTAKQGQYLAFIHRYLSRYGRAPAESDIQRHFLVSAPTVNQMMQRLERLGLITRTPGQARSIRLLVAPEWFPRS